MPIAHFVGTTPGATPNALAPNATTGSWGWGPLTIDYTFTFAAEFFDGDLKILGVKVATVTLNSDGNQDVNVSAFGWTIDGTVTISTATKNVVAQLTISEGTVVKFNHEFVIFSW